MQATPTLIALIDSDAASTTITVSPTNNHRDLLNPRAHNEDLDNLTYLFRSLAIRAETEGQIIQWPTPIVTPTPFFSTLTEAMEKATRSNARRTHPYPNQIVSLSEPWGILPAGTEFTFRYHRDGQYRVESASGNRLWIPASSLEWST